MTKKLPEFGNLATANMVGLISAAESRSKILRRMIHGESPRLAPTRWRVAANSVDTIPTWLTFPGDSNGGRLPRNYKQVGLIDADKEMLDTLRENAGGVHAIAFAVGSVIVAGVRQDKSNFDEDHEDSSWYQVAPMVGRGDLVAATGLWLHEERMFIAPVQDRAYINLGMRPIDGVPEGWTIV